MTDRTQFIETMRRTARVMEKNLDAHTAYTDASAEANIAFCAFANRYGHAAADGAAQQARDGDFDASA